MRNGDIIIKSKTSDDSPVEFHVYNTHGQKIKTLKPTCQHEADIELLPLVIQSEEYLAESCWTCRKIRLRHFNTGTVTEAFSDTRYLPGRMSHGSSNTIYVVHMIQPCPVLVLDTSTTMFRLIKTIKSDMLKFYDICYIPIIEMIVISNNNPTIIRAVSLTSQILWELTGSVDGAACNPHGLVYSHRHDALLAADGNNSRIFVLQPESGQCLQTIDLSQHVLIAWEPHLYEDQLVLYHAGKDGKPKISYFAVSVYITTFCVRKLETNKLV